MRDNSSFLSWDNYYNLIAKGLKVFVYYLSVLSLCRLIFVWLMSDYMGEAVVAADIQLALFYGTKLSVQTAGIMALITMLPVVATRLAYRRGERAVTYTVTGIVLMVTSILFFASFPYYKQFHSKFHQVMFNAVNDDMFALFISMVQEFYLPLRLAGALLFAYVLWKLLNRLLQVDFTTILPEELQYFSFGQISKWLFRAIWIFLLYLLGRLMVFGGSLGWETAIDWENAGVTKDSFLNEAILDDYQAIYRGYRMNGRLLACNGLNFTTEQIRDLAAGLANMPPDSNNLDVYLRREAQGNQVERPKQIFVIISESYANWPLLDKYASLHIADGMKGIINAADADYCDAFLPNGSSTVSAVTGVVTGLADANLYLTTMPESFAGAYPTAIAPQMEALGYETNFWYAGPATWERIGDFTIAQGFDHFYGRGNLTSEATGSVWGCDDEYLYASVMEKTSANRDSFNVILNVSNHSPYNVDVAAKGFDAQSVIEALPETARADSGLVNELGHYWYADKQAAIFIKKIKEKYPDSLIVFFGDHADRYNIDKTPSMYERYAIPFVITGKGVHKGLLCSDAAGSQIDVGATILELVAPKGYNYMSIGSSLTRNNRQGVNYGFWITHDFIGEADIYPLQPIAIEGRGRVAIDELQLQRYIDAVRSMSWWRPKYGPVLDPVLLEGRE